MNLIDELIKLSEDPFSGGAVDPDPYRRVAIEAGKRVPAAWRTKSKETESKP